MLGSQNQEKILRLVEGKTLELNKKMSIGYRIGPKVPEILSKKSLIESLENQAKNEGLPGIIILFMMQMAVLFQF